MSALHALRKLVFGETWVLPIGIGIAVGITALARLLEPKLWGPGWSGVLLLLLLLAALWGSLANRRG